VLSINGRVYGKLTRKNLVKILEEYRKKWMKILNVLELV
jgi:hypothetical protein